MAAHVDGRVTCITGPAGNIRHMNASVLVLLRLLVRKVVSVSWATPTNRESSVPILTDTLVATGFSSSRLRKASVSWCNTCRPAVSRRTAYESLWPKANGLSSVACTGSSQNGYGNVSRCMFPLARKSNHSYG